MFSDMEPQTDPNRTRARRFLVAFALIAVLWWALSDGDATSWKLGVPAALAAALMITLQPGLSGWRISPLGGLRFAGFYLLQSLRGGVDVALRALKPSLPLAPGFVEYRTRLPRGPARTFFVAVIGLLPGTLTVRIAGRDLTVHVLDCGMPIGESLAQLEVRIAGLFALALEDGDAA